MSFLDKIVPWHSDSWKRVGEYFVISLVAMTVISFIVYALGALMLKTSYVPGLNLASVGVVVGIFMIWFMSISVSTAAYEEWRGCKITA